MTSSEIIDVLLRLRGGRQFRQEADKAAGGLDHVKKKTKDTEYAAQRATFRMGRFRTTLGHVGTSAFSIAGIAGIGGLTEAVHLSVDAFGKQQAAAAQTAAVLKSTRGAAHVTRQGVDELARSLSLKTGVDHASVQSAMNLLLTFRAIRNEAGKGNDVFDQSSAAVLNLARSMHKDPTNAALILGKALNDPIHGLLQLRRIGIQFSDSQVKQIKIMAAHGNMLGAQKTILREVNTEFGHSAQAYAHTLPGSIARFKNAMTELGVSIGKKLAPTLTHVANKVGDFVNGMVEGKGAGGQFAGTVSTIWHDLRPLVHLLGSTVKFLAAHPHLLEAAGAAWIAYKAAALLELGTLKAAQLGLLGAGMRKKLATEAAETGGTEGKLLGSTFAAKAGLVAAAGIAGWQIGSWLRKHVPAVRSAGDWLGKNFAHALGIGGESFKDKIRDAESKVRDQQTAARRTQLRGQGRFPLRHAGTYHAPTRTPGGGPEGSGQMPRLSGHVAARASSIAGDRGPSAPAHEPGGRRGGTGRERVKFVTVHGRVLAEAVFDEADQARARS